MDGFNKKDYKRQDLLLHISQSLIQTLDYEEVLQIISDGMSDLLEIETAAIYLIEDEDTLFLGATTPELPAEVPEYVRIARIQEHPHIDLTIKTRSPQVVADTRSADLSPQEKAVTQLRNIKSLLILPFVKQDSVIGALFLGTTKKQRYFAQPEIDFGQTVANQLSIGIQNAKLHRDLLLKNKSLENEIEVRREAERNLIKAKHRIEENEFLFRNLFNQAAEGILLMDFYGNVLKTNNAFASMHGYSIEEVLQSNVSSFDTTGDGAISLTKKYIDELLNGKIISQETDHLHKDGRHFPLSVTSQVIDLKGDKFLLCFHQDLTDKKRVEEELRQHRNHLKVLVREKTAELDATIEELKAANDELVAKNTIIKTKNVELNNALRVLKEARMQLVQSEKMASLGILTAGVAHEINNPLNYIMGSYYALQTYFDDHQLPEPEFVSSILDGLHQGVEKATEIVRGLNQFSRDNKQRDELCNVHEILDNCLSMLNNKIKYVIEVDKNYYSGDLQIKGNVGQLHQALLNILTNAVQAMPEQGKLSIATAKDGNKAMIAVKDTGVGIEDADLGKITDPFYTTKPPGEGTGLGLSITYTILKEHGGSMDFSSAVNHGTTVTLSLPLLVAVDDNSELTESE